jgi:hypothetical protein
MPTAQGGPPITGAPYAAADVDVSAGGPFLVDAPADINNSASIPT